VQSIIIPLGHFGERSYILYLWFILVTEEVLTDNFHLFKWHF